MAVLRNTPAAPASPLPANKIDKTGSLPPAEIAGPLAGAAGRRMAQRTPERTAKRRPTPLTYASSLVPASPRGTLHMGHWRNYVSPDVIRPGSSGLRGRQVLQPDGWDAFGAARRRTRDSSEESIPATGSDATSPRRCGPSCSARVRARSTGPGGGHLHSRYLPAGAPVAFPSFTGGPGLSQKEATVNWDPRSIRTGAGQ